MFMRQSGSVLILPDGFLQNRIVNTYFTYGTNKTQDREPDSISNASRISEKSVFSDIPGCIPLPGPVSEKEFIMDFFNRDMYEQGLKFQKSMMDQYLQAVKKTTDFFQGKPENEEEMTSAFEVFTKTTEDMLRSAGEVNESLWKAYQESWEQWKKIFGDAEGFSLPEGFKGMPFKDISSAMERFLGSMSIYTKLFQLWQDAVKSWPDNMSDPASAAARYADQTTALIRELSENILKPVVTEDVFSVWESISNLGSSSSSFFQDFAVPWLDRQDDFLECVQSAAAGDMDSYSRYMDLLTEAYQESYGKLLNMHGVGMAKDQTAMNFQLLDSYVRMMLSYFQMSVGIQKNLQAANQDLWKKMQDAVNDSEKAMTFKDFYDMWIRVNSNAINNFYFTDEFAGFLGSYADNAYDFKKNWDEFLEKALSTLPIPTNSEMKSVYKTVYDLRKEVRALKKEIKDLRAELDELK